MRSGLRDFYVDELDIDVVEDPPEPAKPEPEPEPESEPEPEPEPEAAPEAAPTTPQPTPDAPPPEAKPDEEDSYDDDDDEPPPAPSEAADVLTAGEEGDEEDLTRYTIVDKDGSKQTGGGQTSAKGTAKGPVYDKNAKVGGTPGGKGTGPVKPPKPRPNLSRPAGLAGSRSWNCPFPAQADLEQVDSAMAVVAVTVGANGRALSVRVLSDPGYGFGAAARRCAYGRSYTAARDRDGKAITATMPPVRVRFRRR
jgi:periplasmic protein TonB